MLAVRGHNEGSVSHYRDGLIVVRVTMRDGARRSRSVAADHAKSPTCERDDRRQARPLLEDLLRQRDGGAVGHDPTLGRYLERWLDAVAPHLAPATWRKHESIVRAHLIPSLGRHRLSELSVDHVRAYMRHAKGHPQTIRHHRATLRRALADAQRDGLVIRNVAALAEPPKLTTIERSVLDADQARALLATLAEPPNEPPEGATLDADQARRLRLARIGHRLYALFVLALHTGMRQAELLGLQWSAVDLDAGTVHVGRTLQRVWTGEVDEHDKRIYEWLRRSTKTPKSRRDITLTPSAIAALRIHRERQEAERGARMLDGLVFTTPAGHPIHGTNLLPVLREALATAGLPRVSFHDLRHSAATILYAHGVPLETIADMLGHSTVRVTQDLYRHRVPQLQREAAERMQEALG